ncbi:tetratricopeptide repeat protein [Micromonospora sp. NPDC049891]|uniref:tetratricopeptide repeat protein n=1 Tax=Micromonospora sp. NPDC049891 TaxID=3155655 RepID=UPI003403ED8E
MSSPVQPDGDNPQAIGDILRTRRTSLGLTQADLARRAGISVRSVRNLERGCGGSARPQTLQRLASAVGLSDLGSPVPRPRRGGIHITVLGPLAVHHNGREVPIHSLMQRRLLGLLALHPAQLVPTADIVEVLWAGRPPATHPNLIHGYVGALRKSLEPERESRSSWNVVVTGVNGYRLALDRDQIDLARFDELVKRARGQSRREDAYDDYEQALQCWRGPVDPAIHHHPAAVAAAQQRIVATLAFADLAIDLRRYDAAVRWLDPLSREEPLHEGLHARLLLALAGSGQQAEALHHFASVRARIVQELGVEPGPQLTDAHLRVLRQELPGGPAGRPAPRRDTAQRADVTPFELPAATSFLVGRTQALRGLNRLLPGTVDGRPAAAIAAISGGPGTGKTALAVHWAHSVREHFPDGQLYVNLRGFHPTGPVVSAHEAMRTFLESLGVAPRRIPQSQEGRVNLYRSLLADRRVLVVLDNARDAEHVRPLLPGGVGSAAVVTSRNRLTGLVAVEGVTPVGLEVLSPEESRELVSRRLGAARLAAEPDAAAEIGRLCGHLPLALAILTARATVQADLPLASFVAHLRAERDRLDALRGDETTIDIRAVFSWSYGVLSSAAARLFRLLGAHPGPDISVEAAASLAGCPVDQVRAPLAELVRGSLIEEAAHDRYTLHDLLRMYALELAGAVDTATDRRAATRRMIDHYLSGAIGASGVLDPHREATMPGHPPVGHRHFDSPAQATAWFAAEQQNLFAAQAVSAEAAVRDTSTGAGMDDRTWWLGWALAGHLQRSGHWQQWADTQLIALEAARRLGDLQREAYAHRNIGLAHAHTGDFEKATAYYRRALGLYEQIGDLAGAASTHLNLGWVADRRQRFTEALHHAEQALTLYRSARHPAGEADSLNTIGWYQIQLGDHRSALDLCRQALAVQQAIGDRRGQADTWDSLGYAHHHLGDHEQALAAYRQALALYSEATDRYHESLVLNHMGDTNRAAGDVTAARDLWREALRILDELGHAEAADVRDKLSELAPSRSVPGGDDQAGSARDDAHAGDAWGGR